MKPQLKRTRRVKFISALVQKNLKFTLAALTLTGQTNGQTPG